jgi:site-specific DNA-cytosine methylase
MIGEVVACELRGAARQVHQHAVTQLGREFPTRMSAKAGVQLHHRVPQDIRLVTADHVQALRPIDLEVAGWPCQGSSAAGTGKGLDDSRSGLLVKLLRGCRKHGGGRLCT